ncbi:MAG: hypothetical protein ACOX6Z_05935, partial [Dethiobacteria bacterium]
MQNRYTGDVGDYGKYGLLRCLAAPVPTSERMPRLGVNWYLVPDETDNRDGTYTGYLASDKEPLFRPCDPGLYDRLQVIIRENLRSVQQITAGKILPAGTKFYAETLSYSHLKNKKDARLAHRSRWVQRGLKQLKNCDLVFFDPDNGLGVPSCPRHYKQGIKYAFYDELVDYFKRGQSLIIYNHRDRKPMPLYLERFRKIKKYFPQVSTIFYLRFTSYSVRDYVFVPQPDHINLLKEKIEIMLSGPW